MEVLEYLKSGNEKGHHPLSPSTYPIWGKCPKFENTEIPDNDLKHPANRGTLQHILFEQICNNKVDQDILDELTTEEVEGVKWASEWINSNVDDAVFETQVKYIEGFEELYCGTVDVMWLDREGILHIGDLKTGEKRNYVEQLAAYAAAEMQRLNIDVCICHVIYTKFKWVDEFKITNHNAQGLTLDVISRRQDPNAKPMLCEYCSWCQNISSCELVTAEVVQVAEGYTDGQLKLDSWHPSQLTDPNQMLIALKVSKLLEDWCKSVKRYANIMAIEKGMPIPGTKLRSCTGKTVITDINKALNLSGFNPEEFITACTVSFSDLVNIEKEKTGLSKAKAKKSLEERLSDVIKPGKSSKSVQLLKETKDA